MLTEMSESACSLGSEGSGRTVSQRRCYGKPNNHSGCPY